MGQGLLQIGLTLAVAIMITPILGKYIAKVFMGEVTLLDRVMNPVEQVIYKLADVNPQENMRGRQYAYSLLQSNLFMGILVYLLLTFQKYLPWNPNGFGAMRWDLRLHTTISFLTNTGQQHYLGEKTLSHFSSIAALNFLMFVSAATGLAVGIAFIRGLTGKPLGNYYVDLIRGITRILLPICIIGAIVLLAQGVPQNLAAPLSIETLEGRTQYIATGPVASFEMIKLLGTNGGGFFGANSAHPFENPNGATNLIELIAMMCIPIAMIFVYGAFTNNIKQAWRLFWMIFVVFLALVWITASGEFIGNPIVNSNLGLEKLPNLEGKEVRFGWVQTALWAVITTATMNGAVNGMHDSLMPAGGFSTLLSMFLHVIWGGIGTGIVYLLIYQYLTAFWAGLMVGSTPEFFGRKITKRSIVLASLVVLIHPVAVMIPSAIALAYPVSLSGISNPGVHGISQVVYEYISASANNGSGFEGLIDNTLWWNLSSTGSMLLGRYVTIFAILLLADTMASTKPVPAIATTLKTDTSLFNGLTLVVIFILSFLIFFPILVNGPIAEGFKLAVGQ
ncbi:potassium-transporting ATPase subunit KdpA [Rivularia sp. UHCC 0363]|uniref:potassium-transporting ATPase subunit KdpA n=1 Tax=Rivularia sp. UHCC 0363 TaxID=3110244 RepID=UPI002B1EB44D|nr:potassium-transporting ATPase subunit KdpA [Rivularia sp. UHCC 0363]MEA5593859.1 potassium-transporting ATPase subunit KdpA [Rivularia sp. UHCC 0363]